MQNCEWLLHCLDKAAALFGKDSVYFSTIALMMNQLIGKTLRWEREKDWIVSSII